MFDELRYEHNHRIEKHADIMASSRSNAFMRRQDRAISMDAHFPGAASKHVAVVPSREDRIGKPLAAQRLPPNMHATRDRIERSSVNYQKKKELLSIYK